MTSGSLLIRQSRPSPDPSSDGAAGAWCVGRSFTPSILLYAGAQPFHCPHVPDWRTPPSRTIRSAHHQSRPPSPAPPGSRVVAAGRSCGRRPGCARSPRSCPAQPLRGGSVVVRTRRGPSPTSRLWRRQGEGARRDETPPRGKAGPRTLPGPGRTGQGRRGAFGKQVTRMTSKNGCPHFGSMHRFAIRDPAIPLTYSGHCQRSGPCLAQSVED